jgi:hypothetical protein
MMAVPDPWGDAVGVVGIGEPRLVPGGTLLLGHPTGDHVPHPLAHVHRMVTDALVEAGDHGQLDRHLQVDATSGARFDDGLDHVSLQLVEGGVHVVDRRGLGGIEIDEALQRRLVQHLGLLGHLGDDAPQLGIEIVAIDAACRLADVHAQVGAALDVGSTILMMATSWRRSLATGAWSAINW